MSTISASEKFVFDKYEMKIDPNACDSFAAKSLKKESFLDDFQMERVDVPKDGNCFYSSLLIQLNVPDSIEELRQKIAKIVEEDWA